MNQHATRRLAIALALIYCMPVAFVGCATPQPVAQTAAGAPVAPETMVPAKAKNPTEAASDTTLAGPKPADAEGAVKIIPGTGVFVKPASVTPAPTGAQDIVLNFEGADLREVVRC